MRTLQEIPEYPEDLEYLVEWVRELYGRSGLGMASVAPLSFTTIKAWAELKGIGELHPLEIEALLLLDGVIMTASLDRRED